MDDRLTSFGSTALQRQRFYSCAQINIIIVAAITVVGLCTMNGSQARRTWCGLQIEHCLNRRKSGIVRTEGNEVEPREGDEVGEARTTAAGRLVRHGLATRGAEVDIGQIAENYRQVTTTLMMPTACRDRHTAGFVAFGSTHTHTRRHTSVLQPRRRQQSSTSGGRPPLRLTRTKL